MTAPHDDATGRRIGPCPVCGTPFDLDAPAACAGCRVDLGDEVVGDIHELDRHWNETRLQIAERRDALVARLLATRTPPPPPQSPPQVAPQAAGVPTAPLEEKPSTTPGVAVVLAVGGVALLAVAALVFTAVVWSELPPAAQAAVLLAAAILSTIASVWLHRRHLPAAAGALGVTAVIFVWVDIAAASRFGLLATGDFGPTVAAGIAAVYGWGLARARVPWVATMAAGAAAVTMLAGTAASLSPFDGQPVAASLVTATWAIALATTTPVWSTRPARGVVLATSAAWLAIAGIVALVALGDAGEPLGMSLAAAAVPVIAFVGAGWTWRAPLLAPAALLVSAVPAAALFRIDLVGFRVALATAVVAIIIGLGASRIASARQTSIRAGIVPAAAFVAGACLWAGLLGIVRYVDTLNGRDTALLDPWAAATVVVTLAAVATRAGRSPTRSWIALPAVLTVSAALPTALAWPVLAMIAVALVVVRHSVRPEPFAVLIVAAAAIGWSVDTSWTVATTAAIAAGVGFATAPELAARTARIMAAVIAPLTGLAFAALAHTVSLDIDVVLGTGLAALFVAGLAATWLGIDRPPTAVALVAIAATLFTPAAASDLRASGVLWLLAAVGWLAFAVVGRRGARWLAALAGSVGSAILMADAGVQTIEAYTLVAAALLAAVGVWWLTEDREVRTLTALWPAVSVGLVPSILALAGDPSHTTRTVVLVVVAGLLAAGGLAARWLAPTLAGGVTAIAVALIQLAMLVGQLPRWIAFAAVGALLVALAATYERQRQRMRVLSSHLAKFH